MATDDDTVRHGYDGKWLRMTVNIEVHEDTIAFHGGEEKMRDLLVQHIDSDDEKVYITKFVESEWIRRNEYREEVPLDDND